MIPGLKDTQMRQAWVCVCVCVHMGVLTCVCVLVFCMHLYLSSVMEYFCLDSYIVCLWVFMFK